MALVQPTLDNVPGYLREIYKRLQQIEDIIDASGTGLLAKTAADTYTTRTIAGTTDQISVANGGGVAANPTISLAVGSLLVGTYVPTYTAVTNVDSATSLGTEFYVRIGDTVIVFGAVSINATTAGAATEVGVSLPIASNISSSTGPWGSASATDVAARGFGFENDGTNDRAAMKGFASVDTAVTYTYVFGYRIA